MQTLLGPHCANGFCILDFQFVSQLLKLLLEQTVFREYPGATVEDKKYTSKRKVYYGDQITASSVAINTCHLRAKDRPHKHTECIEKSINVISLVVNLSIDKFVLTFGYLQFMLQSLNHLGNDWNEHKHLEDAHQRESSENKPHVLR